MQYQNQNIAVHPEGKKNVPTVWNDVSVFQTGPTDTLL